MRYLWTKDAKSRILACTYQVTVMNEPEIIMMRNGHVILVYAVLVCLIRETFLLETAEYD